MITALLYIFGSVLLVSLIAVIGILPIHLRKKQSEHLLIFLLSISVGTLLATVFIHFLPEATSHGYTLGVASTVLGGFLAFFLLEKLIHWHHHKKDEESMGHSHAYHLAPINLIGDGVHNFIDGLVIAGSYLADINIGIAATVSVIFHELPQEIADYGVLLYSGLSRKKALLLNFLSALTAVLGAIVGVLLYQLMHSFNAFLLPFAAGNFLYIAASNLVPQLHRHCGLKETVLHIIAILIGVGIMVALVFVGPGHVHG
ncbi:MAG: ZIP family metal transporter [Nanoarchaeota archaeon]